MDSSSENSFVWTDTSSDSFNSTNMVENNKKKTDQNYNFNSSVDEEAKYKKTKSNKLSLNEPVDVGSEMIIKKEEIYCETKSRLKKKKIKVEPESDNDLLKKTKKIKHNHSNGNQNESADSSCYDESHLDMKVKQEEFAVPSSANHKKKKHKRRSSTDSTTSTLKSDNCSQKDSCDGNDEMFTLKQENEHGLESSKTKKKKKKSKKQCDNQDIENKLDIDETVVYKQELTKHHTESSGTGSNLLTAESEESGCDEISAIKCDDSHNLHTISFINNSLEEEIICDDSSNVKKGELLHNSVKKMEATKHRTQRISDRIRFEDDDDTNIESSPVHEGDPDMNTKRSSKLKHFVKINPNLKVLSKTFPNNTTLTIDDEIWILKCPKEIDVKDLNDTSLNIHGKCKIKVGGQTYDGSAEVEQSDAVSLITMEHSKYKIRSLPLSGIIHLRKRIPKAHFRDDNTMVNNQTNFIPLPDTKCRHPLFGSNYKKAMKIPAAIAERLNVQDGDHSLMSTERKKKKNSKKDKNLTEHVDSLEQGQFTMKLESDLSKEVSQKKKKKRKIVDDEGPAPKKVKRIKHDPESAEAWESEKAIEENLFSF